MRAHGTLIAMALAACGSPSSPEVRAADTDSCTASASDAHTLGVPALDRLIALPVDPDVPPRMFVEDASGPRRALFETDPVVLTSVAPRLAAVLDDARRAPLGHVPFEARVVLQNDLWGVWQRLDDAEASPERDRLRASLAAMVARLAPSVAELDAHDGRDLPPIARALVAEADGWRERGTEHSVLSHEALFGMRRVFRVLTRNDERDRALVSQLVALDAEGDAHLVSVVGGMEILELAGDAPRARVLELSRRSLRCGPARLEPMDLVHGLPGLGTNGHLAALDPPAAPVPSVCARCHEDVEGRPDVLMSLPSDDVTRLPRRWAELMEQSTREGRRVIAPSD